MGGPAPRFVLINPNKSAATTRLMVEIAQETVEAAGVVEGMTACAGAPLIADPAALAVAAGEVARMAAEIAEPDVAGVVVAAFGDPGLAAARTRLAVPVAGLAEAAIAEAAQGGRRFAIVTTTPRLDGALRDRVAASGAAGCFAGLRYTKSGVDGMTDPDRLDDELLDACRLAAADGAAAIVIGGGPLALAARRLRQRVPAALIEPVPAAMRRLLAALPG